MREIRTLALALPLLLMASTDALAKQATLCDTEIVQTESVALMTTGWSDSVTFDTFDPNLGTLTGVTVTLLANAQGTIGYESLSARALDVSLLFENIITVFRPGSTSTAPIAQVVPSQTLVDPATSFDGVIDFDGTSGGTFSGLNISESTTANFRAPSPDLALFTGVAGGGPSNTITLPVIAKGNSSGIGSGGFHLLIMQQASASIKLRYTYTPNRTCNFDSIPAGTTSWLDSVTLNKFDPDRGILTEVEITLMGTITGVARYESRDTQPATITLSFQAHVQVFRPGSTDLLIGVAPQVNFLHNATAYDGVLDFGGTSGHTYSNILFSETSSHSFSTPASDLALFTGSPGPGPPGAITLPVNAIGTSTGSGVGGISLWFTQEAAATVSVEYTFDLDCDHNGVADDLEIENGTASDCNLNEIPDVCDILSASSSDNNNDNIPDECTPGISLCNGDGGDGLGCTDCPCTNNAAPGTIGGCLNSAGTSARLAASGDVSASTLPGATTDLRFTMNGAPPGAFGILVSGSTVAPGNPNNACFGLNSGMQSLDRDGLHCTVMNLKRHGGRAANLFGQIVDSTGPSRVWGGEAQPNGGIWKQAGFVAGQTRYFQVTYRENATLGCMRGLNTSQAIGVRFLP